MVRPKGSDGENGDGAEVAAEPHLVNADDREIVVEGAAPTQSCFGESIPKKGRSNRKMTSPAGALKSPPKMGTRKGGQEV
jgi:hypothetical protein